MTAGIMGAGSTSALILGGAWFRYDFLWVTLITLPAVVVCLDSGARIGVLSGGRGFLSVIRDEIHPLVTWIVLGVFVLFDIFVNMGQISVMTTSFLSFAGTYPPGATAGAEEKLIPTGSPERVAATIRRYLPAAEVHVGKRAHVNFHLARCQGGIGEPPAVRRKLRIIDKVVGGE